MVVRLFFIFRIEIAGGFIEHQDFWILNEGVSNSDMLMSTIRNLSAMFIDYRIKAIFQPRQKTIDSAHAGDFAQSFFGYFFRLTIETKGHVITERFVKERHLLIDHSNMRLEAP